MEGGGSGSGVGTRAGLAMRTALHSFMRSIAALPTLDGRIR